MTNIPAPGADLATERLRDLLTAAGNASFECGAHDCDGDGGDPAPYAELARIAAEKRAEIVEFFRATIAAVPASEPVGEVGHVETTLCKRLPAGTKLYAAAPAPVSGMLDLSKLTPLGSVLHWAEEFAKDPQRLAGGMIVHLLKEYAQLRASLALVAPQAPDTPVADERLDPVVEANRALLRHRSAFGIKKYGGTLDELRLSRRALMQHALEEALDLANYLQADIQNIDRALAPQATDQTTGETK